MRGVPHLHWCWSCAATAPYPSSCLRQRHRRVRVWLVERLLLYRHTGNKASQHRVPVLPTPGAVRLWRGSGICSTPPCRSLSHGGHALGKLSPKLTEGVDFYTLAMMSLRGLPKSLRVSGDDEDPRPLGGCSPFPCE